MFPITSSGRGRPAGQAEPRPCATTGRAPARRAGCGWAASRVPTHARPRARRRCRSAGPLMPAPTRRPAYGDRGMVPGASADADAEVPPIRSTNSDARRLTAVDRPFSAIPQSRPINTALVPEWTKLVSNLPKVINTTSSQNKSPIVNVNPDTNSSRMPGSSRSSSNAARSKK